VLCCAVLCAVCWRSHSLTHALTLSLTLSRSHSLTHSRSHSLTHALKVVESICTYTYYWATMQVDLASGVIMSYLVKAGWSHTSVQHACHSWVRWVKQQAAKASLWKPASHDRTDCCYPWTWLLDELLIKLIRAVCELYFQQTDRHAAAHWFCTTACCMLPAAVLQY
jgi:hypothetical protein